MRKSTQTAQELLQIEMEADNRRRSRAKGFAKMKERDEGWARLHEYHHNADIKMRWDLNDQAVVDNKFALVVNGRQYILDAEEVRRWLRWI